MLSLAPLSLPLTLSLRSEEWHLINFLSGYPPHLLSILGEHDKMHNATENDLKSIKIVR